MTEKQPRVRADFQRNRDRIVDTAARMFAERDVEVPLDDIAAAAGLGSATLFRHFNGRLDLVHRVLDERAGKLAAQATDLGLRDWLRELIGFCTAYSGLAGLLATASAEMSLEARQPALLEALRRLVEAAQPRHPVDPRDLLALAGAIALTSAGVEQVAHRQLDLLLSGVQEKTSGN